MRETYSVLITIVAAGLIFWNVGLQRQLDQRSAPREDTPACVASFAATIGSGARVEETFNCLSRGGFPAGTLESFREAIAARPKFSQVEVLGASRPDANGQRIGAVTAVRETGQAIGYLIHLDSSGNILAIE